MKTEVIQDRIVVNMTLAESETLRTQLNSIQSYQPMPVRLLCEQLEKAKELINSQEKILTTPRSFTFDIKKGTLS